MTLTQIQGNGFNGSGGQSPLAAIVCEGATALEKCRLLPEERADTLPVNTPLSLQTREECMPAVSVDIRGLHEDSDGRGNGAQA